MTQRAVAYPIGASPFMEQQYTSPLAAPMRRGPSNGSYPWFALRVRSRYENTVATFLGGKGYEWFLPLYKSRRAWSDRIKETQLPLFPGYIFCRFDLQHRLPILTTPGVVSVVGIGRRPVPIDDAEIAALFDPGSPADLGRSSKSVKG